MKITVSVTDLILLISGVTLLAIGATGIWFFEETYIFLSIGIGLLIGAVLGIARAARKRSQ